MNNILESTNSCTGCGACTAVCPVKAINYKVNKNGFFEATVDEDICISCGKCKKVCLKFLDTKEFNGKLSKAKFIAAQSTDRELLKSCTSGGIAYEISKYAIENGYKVVGVIYNYESNTAETIIIDNLEALEKIKSSKYIQSNTEEAFIKIKENCKKNNSAKYFIFGTPCQIAGFKKMIEIEGIKNEIVSIDLFCHGVPSYLVWENYRMCLKEKYSIDNFNYVNFRSKYYGWHNFTLEIHSEKKNLYNISEKDLFYKAFFDNILLNTSCFDCNVRKEETLADIRLGDFWGTRYEERTDGISLVAIFSEIGQKVIDTLKERNNINIFEEISYEEGCKYQSIHNYKFKDLHYKAFDELKKSNSLEKTIKLYRRQMPKKYIFKMKIKKLTGYLPLNIKRKIKKLYHKLN